MEPQSLKRKLGSALFCLKEWESGEQIRIELINPYFQPFFIIQVCLFIWNDLSPICYQIKYEGDKSIFLFYSVYGSFSISTDIENQEVWLTSTHNIKTLYNLRDRLIKHKSVKKI